MSSFADRLAIKLDRSEIPRSVQREVLNGVCGPEAQDPPLVAWRALRAPLQAHIDSLRSNKARVQAAISTLRSEYYDILVAVNETLRMHDKTSPPPAHMMRWQEWVPESVRTDLIDRFRAAYAQAPEGRGNKLVPFAPQALRADNAERIRRLRGTIRQYRKEFPTNRVGKTPNPRHALFLCAARQAERAIDAYEKALASGELNVYDHPAKVNWQHYCTPEMRTRVRTLLTTGFVNTQGLTSFYDPETTLVSQSTHPQPVDNLSTSTEGEEA